MRRRRLFSLCAGAVVLVLSGCSLGQTDNATYVTDVSATLNGRVSSTENAGQSYDGDQHVVHYWFKYGPTTDYGSETPHQTLTLPAHEYHAEFPVSQPVQGLDASTTYHFQLCAQDAQEGVGPGCTGDETLTTDSPGAKPGIAFQKYTFDGRTETYAAWTMDPDGGNQTVVPSTSGAKYPAFSPDGRKLVFTQPGGSTSADIWTANVDGSNRTDLTPAGGDPAGSPVFSPDGTKIASIDFSQSSLVVMGADGTNPVTLSDAGDVYPTVIAWSPDGRHLCFTRRDGNDTQIAVIDADGKDLTVLSPAGSDDDACSWTPDGRHILYSSGDDRNHVQEMNPDGSDRTALAGPGSLSVSGASASSPDGSKLAFGAGMDIYLADSDGSNAQRLTSAPSGPPNVDFTHPLFSPRP